MNRLGAVTASLIACSMFLPAHAAENGPLRCNTGAARRAPVAAGPALLANVPRAMTPIALNAVQMTDKQLAKHVLVEGLFAMRTSTDTVQVVARLVNCTNRPVTVDARSSFMDAAQLPAEPTSTWRTVHLPPYATGVYQEKSTAQDAVAYYLIEMRSAR